MERLPRPCALAGTAAEIPIATACGIGLAVVFLVEVLTPDTVVGAVSLFPVVAACWLLSSRIALSTLLLCAALFALATVFEAAGRVTLVLVGLPTLVAGLLARAYAISLSAELDRPIRRPIHGSNNGGPLTPRELEVARLAAQAYTAAEIGRQLHIGERTVESHLASTYAKLGINSKPELIRLASRLGPL